MSDADSESSKHNYMYHIYKSTVDDSQAVSNKSPSLDLSMWTAPTYTKHRVNSDEDTHEANSSETRKELPVDQNMFNVLFSRLEETIDRNTQVMQSAMDIMDMLASRPNNRTPLPDDTPFIIPDGKRSDRVVVELKSTFLKISDIDTINQQFEAEMIVQAKWEEPMLQQRNGKSDRDDLDQLIPWEPKLSVMNIDGAFLLSRKTFDIHFHEPGYRYPVVIQLWRFKGFFKENLELEHFPVDVQDLTISMSTERSDKEVDLIEDQTTLSSINTKAFMDQEWSIYKHIEISRDFTTVEYCSSTIHPILHAQCRVARKMGYFVWNIIFIMLLIISLTFAAFTIEYESSDRLNVNITLFLTAVAFKLVVKQSLPTISYLTYLLLIISLTFAAFTLDHDTADRLTVTITLFLTAVAFKLVVKQSLPTISYLTYLDVYVIASLIFLSLQAAQNATMNVLGRYMKSEEVQYYDKCSMVLMAGILVVFHVIFAMFIYRTASKRRRIMKEKDKMYIARREFVEKYGTLPPRFDNGVDVGIDFGSIIPGRPRYDNGVDASADYDSIIPGRRVKTAYPR